MGGPFRSHNIALTPSDSFASWQLTDPRVRLAAILVLAIVFPARALECQNS